MTAPLYLITGASSGIGQATAEAMWENGASLVIAARRGDRLEAIASKLRKPEKSGQSVWVLPVDVTSREELEAAVMGVVKTSGYEYLAGVVACAGCMHYLRVMEFAHDAMDREIDVNVKGLLNSVTTALKVMKPVGKSVEGHIVCISSDAGIKVFDGLAVYSGTKAFVELFCGGLRRELEPSCKVTTICPGTVDTELIAGVLPSIESRKAFGPADDAEVLSASDVAEAVVFAINRKPASVISRVILEPRGEPF